MNSTNMDAIKDLAQHQAVTRQNQAFNARLTHDSEEAEESTLIQKFAAGVGAADKSVVEKLVQTLG